VTEHRPDPDHRPRFAVAAVLTMLLATMLLGAWLLRFSCDDAFITFRYVANAHAGHGLVWNAPPFAPVEGYTGFLWALLLWWVWSWFGVLPPDAANGLSIACGIGQFLLVAGAAMRLRDRRGALLPPAIGLLVVAAVVTNRTFLQWLTSGLETALFDLAVLAWVLFAFRLDERRPTRWLLAWSFAAATAALTRPDGLLLVGATAATALLLWRRLGLRALSRGLSPLLLVVLHVAWRQLTYGEWLPNTYYAKVTAAWPEAGARYLACFVVEHGTWVWAAMVLAWLGVELARARGEVLRRLWLQLPATAAVAAMLFHAGYYVLRVGGDHFEYRVLGHLVPLCALSAAAMAARLGGGMRMPLAVVLLAWLASGVGWLHLALVHQPPPVPNFRATAPHVPSWARPLARWFDSQQAWLQLRAICVRCDRHASVLQEFAAQFPHRMQVEGGNDPFPVFATPTVGLAGWCLPDCTILDVHGLNDWVIARTPVAPPPLRDRADQLPAIVADADTDGDLLLDANELRAAIAAFTGGPTDSPVVLYLADMLQTIQGTAPGHLTRAEAVTALRESVAEHRFMAHERQAPPGYAQALAPNVTVQDGRATAHPRAQPLTAERIREIEAEQRRRIRAR